MNHAATALLALLGKLDEGTCRRSELDELVANAMTLHGHVERPMVALMSLANQASRRPTAIGDPARAIALHERNLADTERVLGAEPLHAALEAQPCHSEAARY